jgi:hydrogenase maturation protein HypF
MLLAEPALHDAVLVMTSANLSDDPLISDDKDAFARLSDVSDAYLLHDRPIERAVDDSIVLDTTFGTVPLRRARGFVPEPIALPIAASQPGLCTGGELKNAVAVVRGAQAVLSQHIGDLTWSLAYGRFLQTIEDLRRLFDCDINWIACDMHPRYASHAFARRAASDIGADLIAVQHHHAHLASLLAEHGRTNRIIGLICDGTGYGDDGSTWGGEILVGDLTGYERVARMRPLLLPGGDAAARRIGRCGVSWLHDTLGGRAAEDHPLTRRALPDHGERVLVTRLLADDRHCPPSSGMGRLFDAAAALLGLCDYNHHEAMSGMLMESSAAASRRSPSGHDVLDLTVGAEGLIDLDHRPLLLRLIDMMDRGAPTPDLAWLFHDALADGLVRAVQRVADRSGITTVGLSGGVFCNELLTTRVCDRLDSSGCEVLMHRTVPPNDGGLALGQAAVAAATLSARTEGASDVSRVAGQTG